MAFNRVQTLWTDRILDRQHVPQRQVKITVYIFVGSHGNDSICFVLLQLVEVLLHCKHCSILALFMHGL